MSSGIPAGIVPVRVFVSSAEGDKDLRRDLLEELKRKLKGVRIRATSLDDVQPGDVVAERRSELLEEAQFIVLLVTSTYLASLDLRDESSMAMERSKARMATVIPVILTDQDFSDHPFADVVKLRPKNWNYAASFSKEIAREIHDTIIRRVQSRLTGDGEGTAALWTGNGHGRHFRSNWTTAAAMLVLAALATLFWFSADPAAHHIEYESHSKSAFVFNSLVIGVAAMSLIQITRRIFRVRGAFHRDVVEEWLGAEASEELYREVGPQRIDDMFDLSSELLTGQLSAIADRLMEKQARNQPVSALIRRMAAERGPVQTSVPAEQDPRIGYAMAIQRNLDEFQISTSAQWGRYLLKTSILLSMALFILGLRLLNYGGFISGLVPPETERHPALVQAGNFVLLVTGTVLTGLFAGFLGSIARDVVAILEKLRR